MSRYTDSLVRNPFQCLKILSPIDLLLLMSYTAKKYSLHATFSYLHLKSFIISYVCMLNRATGLGGSQTIWKSLFIHRIVMYMCLPSAPISTTCLMLYLPIRPLHFLRPQCDENCVCHKVFLHYWMCSIRLCFYYF